MISVKRKRRSVAMRLYVLAGTAVACLLAPGYGFAAAPAAAVDAYNRGAIAQKARNLDEAIHDYDQAIATDGTMEFAWANLGTVYLDKGDDDRAIADLTRAVSLDDTDALAHGNRGKAY